MGEWISIVVLMYPQFPTRNQTVECLMAESEAMVASAAAARDGKETSVNSGYRFFRQKRHVVLD